MSISAYGRINKKKMDTALFIKDVSEYFSPEGKITISNNGACDIVSFKKNNTKVQIFFSEDDEPPFNVWDSDIINGGFESEQLIIFDVEKEEFFPEWYIEFIKYCILLSEKIGSDILFTSDAHNDICLIKGNDICWSQSHTEKIKQLFEETYDRKR